MKRLHIIALAAIILLCSVCYLSGLHDGVRHAVYDSALWTVTCYDPDDPDASAWNGYDQLIYMELDGQTYEHGCYQG